MRTVAAIMVVLIAVVFTGSVFATPPGRNVEYAGGGAGKVIFDGKAHADVNLRCIDCHPTLFQMRREAKITMADHKADKFCFACHNGKRAFGSENNCAKCHTK
jgi:c(7)-type cytochrome triheme protein